MRRATLARSVAALAFLTLASGCSRTSAQQPAAAAATGSGDVVATVGSTSITLAEVDRKALQQQASTFGAVKLSEALYEARRAALEDLVDNLLIDQDAKARGLDRAALIQQDVTAKVAPVSDNDVAAWFEQNKARLPQGTTLDQARTAVRAYLLQQHTLHAREGYLDTLRSKTAIRVMLDPPRETIPKADRPTKGPADAPVEMIEFSDFQCPYCERAFPVVGQVLKTYGNKIHFVYRHFPLASHPQARPAAEASECAAEQGKFWEFHDLLFGDQSKLGEADLKQHAVELGLDAAKFDACVDSRKYKDLVDTDISTGEEAGVTGTPTFFINGRELSGAQPFDAFKSVIDEELARR